MKKKIIIVISIIIGLIGLYFAYQGIFGEKELPYTTEVVSRGDVIQNVSVTGTVIPAKQIDLQFENQGKISRIETKVGDRVSTDQVLIRLNTAELNAQLKSNQAALDITQAKLAQTLAGSRPEDIQVYQAAVDNTQIEVFNKEQALIDAQADVDNDLNVAYEDALDSVKTAYTVTDQALLIIFAGVRKNYFNGSSQLSIAVKDKESVAKNDLSIAEDYLDVADNNPMHNNIDSALNSIKTAVISTRNALAYLRAALDDPSVSNSVSSADETSIDTERVSIDNQLVNLTSAEQSISSTKITNQANINTAEANLNTAKTNLNKAKDELTLKKAGPRQTDIDLAQAEVNQAQANILQIYEKINKTILKAPTNGVITVINKEEGETAQANLIIISMISTGNFQIEANISETEISKVNLGDGIDMTLDALGPDEKFTGQIVKIDPAETIVSGVIYYKTTSIFDVEDERIKSGMTVNLDIETDKKENILYLPYYSIKEIDGRKYVIVMEDGKREEKTITIGLEGETRVEILSGLEENQEVIIER
ncbi:MAG: efflux RND transporter periplasmic adaptor subunit [Patescibacteria group bacterium]